MGADEQRWISDAQVAETTYTAFTSRARRHRVTARLIVRRVKRLNPKTAPQGQDELFSVYRYHAVFTTLHLPANSRRERPFMTMFDNILAPPQAA